MTFLKPLDTLVATCFLILGTWFCFYFIGENGSKALIFVKNQQNSWYSLKGEDKEIHIKTHFGTYQLLRKEGTIQIIKAPCTHKICVKQGKISSTHERLICVPGRLLVKIQGDEEHPSLPNQLDGVTF